MNIKEFDVIELSTKEQKNLNGGWILWVIGTLIYLYDNKEDLIAGLKEGYQAARESHINHL